MPAHVQRRDRPAACPYGTIEGMQPGQRAIIHVDRDAFYASVEELDDPSLVGKPVIVAGLGRRGVVSTANYEARKYGVRSAMATSEARRRCPDGVYIFPRHDRYAAIEAATTHHGVPRIVPDEELRAAIDA